MSAGHTPGPWRANGHQIAIANGMGLSVAIVYSPELGFAPESEAEREANASLIAAAPDLLEALTMVRDADDDCRRDGLPTIPHAARAKIDAAINKATGETS